MRHWKGRFAAKFPLSKIAHAYTGLRNVGPRQRGRIGGAGGVKVVHFLPELSEQGGLEDLHRGSLFAGAPCAF